MLKLIENNPDLEILPMVNSEVVAGDGYACWCGSFGTSEIDYVWADSDRVYFRSHDEDEMIDDLMEDLDGTQFPNLEALEKEATKRIDEYQWQKVIVVYIGEV